MTTLYITPLARQACAERLELAARKQEIHGSAIDDIQIARVIIASEDIVNIEYHYILSELQEILIKQPDCLISIDHEMSFLLSAIAAELNPKN